MKHGLDFGNVASIQHADDFSPSHAPGNVSPPHSAGVARVQHEAISTKLTEAQFKRECNAFRAWCVEKDGTGLALSQARAVVP